MKRPAWQAALEEGEISGAKQRGPKQARAKPSWKLADSDSDDEQGEPAAAASEPAAPQPQLANRLLAEAAAFAARNAPSEPEPPAAAAEGGAEAPGAEGGQALEDALRQKLLASAPSGGSSATPASGSPAATEPERSPALGVGSAAEGGLEGIGSRTVDNFEKEAKMGEGQYGAVYSARDKQTGELVALKKVKMEREREGFPITSLREMNILSAIDHPYIVGVKEIVVGTDYNSIFMVMELSTHDLKSVLERQKQPFTLAEVKTLMQQLLSGVEHIHDNWVLHRDLKTSNLLYERGILKICDFGLARPYGSPLKDYTVPVVTLYYRSIELLLGARRYSTPVRPPPPLLAPLRAPFPLPWLSHARAVWLDGRRICGRWVASSPSCCCAARFSWARTSSTRSTGSASYSAPPRRRNGPR